MLRITVCHGTAVVWNLPGEGLVSSDVPGQGLHLEADEESHNCTERGQDGGRKLRLSGLQLLLPIQDWS